MEYYCYHYYFIAAFIQHFGESTKERVLDESNKKYLNEYELFINLGKTRVNYSVTFLSLLMSISIAKSIYVYANKNSSLFGCSYNIHNLSVNDLRLSIQDNKVHYYSFYLNL